MNETTGQNINVLHITLQSNQLYAAICSCIPIQKQVYLYADMIMCIELK